MNLLKSLSIFSLTLSLGFTQTTMCFKQNHKNFATIELVKLDGGLCASKKSLQDMKKEGWSTDDIKMDGNNFIYILKKDELANTGIDMEKLEATILKRLEQKEVADNIRLLEEKKFRMTQSGKALYIKKCESCHGEKGEVAYGTSREINKLSLYDFQQTLRDYDLRQYDRGQAIVMYPYANGINSKDIKNLYQYLQSINKK
ncbi:MAG: c-type cytochrome [Arcobacter sp.]|uniref:c-type cytochrome n=1 Tax=Arcobacter sp. TaxID=1872629 RepID=UPI003B00B229